MSTKRKAPAKIAQPIVKPTFKPLLKSTIDETRTAVSAADTLQSVLKPDPETIEISSDSDSDNDVSDDESQAGDIRQDTNNDGSEDSELHADTTAHFTKLSQVNGVDTMDQLPSPNNTSPQPDPEAADSDVEPTSPTFGELLRGTIDVPAVLSQPSDISKAVIAHAPRTTLAPPSLSSLGTVLSQALRTEDTDLLESCLQITNLETVQQTIERLDSSLAGILLTKLAARFHRRPGRAGTLMIWVKWILVAHGGALAVQPDVLQRLVALQKVLSERSKGLPSLLALKGKLDMLEAQMQLRRQRQRRGGADEIEEDEEEDEDDAIYVEGDQDDGSDVQMANGIDARRKATTEDEDDDEMPTTNGFMGDSDDDDDSDEVESEESEGLDDSLDEDEVDHDDIEDSGDDDDDSDVDTAPPSKVRKVASSFTKKR